MSKIIYLISLLLYSAIGMAQSPNSWNRMADFGGHARFNAIAFNIDSFGYIGLGQYVNDTFPNPYVYPTDLWQYNPYTNVWTQKASFPGTGRELAISFTVGSKAYVGLGDQDGNSFKDIWEYDPATDSWTQKGYFGGGYRTAAIGFSIGNRGYAGLGSSGPSSPGYKRDLWEYDPSSDTWIQKNNFPGSGVGESSLFNLGGLQYVGLGYNLNTQTCLRDFWNYNNVSNTWTQLANFSPDSIHGGAVVGPNFAFAIRGRHEILGF
jgi:N-acetylneuraminic acid mutarotase